MQKLFDSGPMMASRGYPRPPWADVQPETLEDLVVALMQLGYASDAIRGILGGNFLRVASLVWR